jgi:hypothetical protein
MLDSATTRIAVDISESDISSIREKSLTTSKHVLKSSRAKMATLNASKSGENKMNKDEQAQKDFNEQSEYLCGYDPESQTTSDQRYKNLCQVQSVLQEVIPFFHEEEEAGVKFRSITEQPLYTDMGKLGLWVDGDGCDVEAIAEAIDRVTKKVLDAKITSKMTVTVKKVYPWMFSVIYEFVF